ncbi:MAG: sulfate ABC transporter substrate-binding protein [Alcaligenaceae bacterium]|nr:sulfate ABC transporter substrate-binding protein [Alcaligenaceae bacterium]
MQFGRNLLSSLIKPALALSVAATAVFGVPAQAQDGRDAFLNVSYDVMRDFYKDFNPLFQDEFAAKHDGEKLTIQQSHAASSRQAMSVANGLLADVVTMNQSSDIQLLVDKGLIDADWEQEFPDNSVPFTSLTVILVRKDNPKNIQDWEDLTKEGVEIVIANPKITGNGRYAFLALYGAALKQYDNDHEKAKELASGILKNVPILENGGRAATTTFIQRGIGDVLLTFENEAHMAANEFGKDQFEVIYPKYSIKAENPVAIVDTVVARKGSEETAKEYLSYLWSEPAQELAASLYLRPSDEKVLEKHTERFPTVDTFRATEVFGGWPEIMQTFFADGGIFDEVNKR